MKQQSNAEVMDREWRRATLRDVVNCKGGTSFPPALQGRKKGAIPFYKVSDMNAPGNARLMDAANNYVEPSDLPRLKAKTHEPLSVVFPKVGGALLTNKKRMLSRPSLVDNNIMVVQSLDFTVCNPHFLLMLFESINLRELSNPGPLPSINATRVYDWPVSLPPLPEQKKIAAVLLKIQQAIEMQVKIIQVLHELKKSTMQHLFTHGLRGEKTKMTEIGEIPESWEEATLGELCKEGNGGAIQTGPFGSQLHAADYEPTGVPVVNPTHMLDNKVIHEGIPRVNEETAKRLVRHVLEVGDILFARRGEIGRHALINKEEAGWLCGTGCFLVRISSSRVENDFISWSLYTSQNQEWLLAHAAGSIMPNLNNRILRACPVAFPKLAEQRRITEMLSRIVGKLSFHESKKSALQDLFKTTLNKLMTGEIRVGDLDIDVREVECAEQT